MLDFIYFFSSADIIARGTSAPLIRISRKRKEERCCIYLGLSDIHGATQLLRRYLVATFMSDKKNVAVTRFGSYEYMRCFFEIFDVYSRIHDILW